MSQWVQTLWVCLSAWQCLAGFRICEVCCDYVVIITSQIFLTSAIFLVFLLLLIHFIGGECDKDWKEWLLLATGFDFIVFFVGGLILIWGMK